MPMAEGEPPAIPPESQEPINNPGEAPEPTRQGLEHPEGPESTGGNPELPREPMEAQPQQPNQEQSEVGGPTRPDDAGRNRPEAENQSEEDEMTLPLPRNAVKEILDFIDKSDLTPAQKEEQASKIFGRVRYGRIKAARAGLEEIFESSPNVEAYESNPRVRVLKRVAAGLSPIEDDARVQQDIARHRQMANQISDSLGPEGVREFMRINEEEGPEAAQEYLRQRTGRNVEDQYYYSLTNEVYMLKRQAEKINSTNPDYSDISDKAESLLAVMERDELSPTGTTAINEMYQAITVIFADPRHPMTEHFRSRWTTHIEGRLMVHTTAFNAKYIGGAEWAKSVTSPYQRHLVSVMELPAGEASLDILELPDEDSEDWADGAVYRRPLDQFYYVDPKAPKSKQLQILNDPRHKFFDDDLREDIESDSSLSGMEKKLKRAWVIRHKFKIFEKAREEPDWLRSQVRRLDAELNEKYGQDKPGINHQLASTEDLLKRLDRTLRRGNLTPEERQSYLIQRAQVFQQRMELAAAKTERDQQVAELRGQLEHSPYLGLAHFEEFKDKKFDSLLKIGLNQLEQSDKDERKKTPEEILEAILKYDRRTDNLLQDPRTQEKFKRLIYEVGRAYHLGTQLHHFMAMSPEYDGYRWYGKVPARIWGKLPERYLQRTPPAIKIDGKESSEANAIRAAQEEFNRRLNSNAPEYRKYAKFRRFYPQARNVMGGPVVWNPELQWDYPKDRANNPNTPPDPNIPGDEDNPDKKAVGTGTTVILNLRVAARIIEQMDHDPDLAEFYGDYGKIVKSVFTDIQGRESYRVTQAWATERQNMVIQFLKAINPETTISEARSRETGKIYCAPGDRLKRSEPNTSKFGPFYAPHLYAHELPIPVSLGFASVKEAIRGWSKNFQKIKPTAKRWGIAEELISKMVKEGAKLFSASGIYNSPKDLADALGQIVDVIKPALVEPFTGDSELISYVNALANTMLRMRFFQYKYIGIKPVDALEGLNFLNAIRLKGVDSKGYEQLKKELLGGRWHLMQRLLTESLDATQAYFNFLKYLIIPVLKDFA